MNLVELREKQASFQNQLPIIREERVALHKVRKKFVSKFPIAGIEKLKLNDYVLGRYFIDNKESFCYWLEKKLEDLGKISGSPAWQYGVYYGTYKKNKDKEYRFMQRWGDTLESAFSEVKASIFQLLEAGRRKNLDAIASNKIADKLKGKILSTYYPEHFLNIFSQEYLNDVLLHFNLDDKTSMTSEAIYKQQKLIEFKNEDKVMVKWALDEFAVFINDEMTRNFYNNNEADPDLEDFVNPKFPPLSELTIETVDFDLTNAAPAKFAHSKNGTVEKKARLLKKIGTRGELIVIEYEKEYLINNKRKDLAAKIIHTAKTDDSAGYDIISYDIDGRKKYIEVKATILLPGSAQFFISANEKEKAETLTNYLIYIVHGITTYNPKVWKIGNVFSPLNKKMRIEPVAFSVRLN